MARTMRLRAHEPSFSIAERVGLLDWAGIGAELDAHGCATTGPLLSAKECAALADCYPIDTLFRSRVIMARHGFGREIGRAHV